MDLSLELSRGLDDRQLAAIADLEGRVVAADGGRLRLEWATLRDRPSAEIRDFLCWRGDRLLGFLGLYGFGRPSAEITGMVDPGWRRQGIASALLETALPVCRRRRPERVLLVVPRTEAGGREFALRHGAALEHSEHALVLTSQPVPGAQNQSVSIRRAASADLAALSGIYFDGFGVPFAQRGDQLHSDRMQTLVVERQGDVVGVLRATQDEDQARITDFVIASHWRGRGIGRDVLSRVCRALREDGVQRIGLEVEARNARALSLYTSTGFVWIAGEDYYQLPDGS